MRRALAAAACAIALAAAGALYVQHAQPGWWVRLWYPLAYRPLVTGYARIYHLDPALVAAVVYEESRFEPRRRSHAGAVGLMQLLPATARGIAERTGGTRFDPRTDLLDPDLNLRYGCWYLRHLLNRYRGYANTTALALAAYNAGQANVDAWIRAAAPGARAGIRFPETRAYVARVLHLRTLYRRGYGDDLQSG